MAKLLICGGRHFNNYRAVEFYADYIINNFFTDKPIEIVSGGCSGADSLGEFYANGNDIPVKIFPANWTKYGRKAGPIRNKQMIDYIKDYRDKAVLAFVSKNSIGTKYTVDMAKKNGIPTFIVEYEVETSEKALDEGIKVVDGKVIFDWESDDDSDIINLTSVNIKQSVFKGIPRFFGYSIKRQKGKDILLKYIKDNVDTDPNIVEMIEKCVDSFYTDSTIKHFDYVLKVPSHSTVNNILCDRILEHDNTKIVPISKKDVSELNVDWDKVKRNFKLNYYQEFCDYISRVINYVKKDETFSISKIPPRIRQYIKPMFLLNNDIDKNSNVLIVDDVFTSGSTVSMVINELMNYGFDGDITVLSLINNK